MTMLRLVSEDGNILRLDFDKVCYISEEKNVHIKVFTDASTTPLNILADDFKSMKGKYKAIVNFIKKELTVDWISWTDKDHGKLYRFNPKKVCAVIETPDGKAQAILLNDSYVEINRRTANAIEKGFFSSRKKIVNF